MKHEQIRTWFNLKVKGRNLTVRPYNGETTRKHKRDVSWSQGFTHFEIRETGTTGFAGIDWFEKNAKPIKAFRAPKAPVPVNEDRIILMKRLVFKKIKPCFTFLWVV